MVLTQGQNYVVASLKSATQGYIGVNSSAPAAWHPTSGAITHIRDRWASSTTVTTFPASTSSQWHWGPADFAYTTGPGITVAATAGTSQNVYANSTGTGSNGISAGTFTLSANSSGAATLKRNEIPLVMGAKIKHLRSNRIARRLVFQRYMSGRSGLGKIAKI